MPKAWKLDTDITLTATHYKIANINIEVPRPYLTGGQVGSKPGKLEVWFAPTNKDGVEIEEPGIAGLQMVIEEPVFTTIAQISWSGAGLDIDTLAEFEDAVYLLAQNRGVLPAGALETI